MSSHLAADLKSANTSFFGQLQSQATRQTLALLATVRSSFTRPTLSVLWRYLQTDKALLHLLAFVEIAREPPRKDWQWDWHNDPLLASGSDLAAIITSMTLMCFAGNARNTRNQRSALEVFNLYHDRDWRMTKRALEGDIDDMNVNVSREPRRQHQHRRGDSVCRPRVHRLLCPQLSLPARAAPPDRAHAPAPRSIPGYHPYQHRPHRHSRATSALKLAMHGVRATRPLSRS